MAIPLTNMTSWRLCNLGNDVREGEYPETVVGEIRAGVLPRLSEWELEFGRTKSALVRELHRTSNQGGNA